MGNAHKTMGVRMVKNVSAICMTLIFCACASSELDIKEPSTSTLNEAEEALSSADIGPSRDAPKDEMNPIVRRVDKKIRKSAQKVCNSLDLPQGRCDGVPLARVKVYTNNERVNAFADDKGGEIGMLGGLVAKMGTDDEVAAVLAHEYSHIMYKHGRKKAQNKTVGTVAGGVIGAGIGYAIGRATGIYPLGLMTTGAGLGAMAGAAYYSQKMEIEADRTAVYILEDAGFDTSAVKTSIIRMSRIKDKESVGDNPAGTVDFFRTHPNYDRRVAHIASAIRDAEAGKPLKDLKRGKWRSAGGHHRPPARVVKPWGRVTFPDHSGESVDNSASTK